MKNPYSSPVRFGAKLSHFKYCRYDKLNKSKLSGLVHVFRLVLPLVHWWWCFCWFFLCQWTTEKRLTLLVVAEAMVVVVVVVDDKVH